jgi:tetratricopeptide (TPR) repeat protein
MRLLLSLALICSGLAAHAELDAESQKILIEKLGKVYLELAPQDPSKVPVTLRLADLYAERARQNAQAACTNCPDPQADREKALRLYNEVLDRAPEAARTKVMIQVGHLYQLNGRDDLAVKFYEKVLSAETDPAVQAEAQLSMAEIAFKKRDYKSAIARYEQVLKYPKASSRGLAAYRRAWSRFHLGERAQAEKELVELLSTPELLVRNGAQHDQVDVQFQEEVSRDLATFMASEKVTQEGIDSLYKLSPESTRISNVQALASEAERLGKKEEALLTLNFISGKLSNPAERVAAQLSMAQLQLDRADKASALKNYENAMQTWKEIGYKETPAQQELRRRAHNFPVSWNQAEKKNPSAELLTAYELYLSMFPQDLDTQLYAAQISKDIKNYQGAWTHYSAARALAKDPAKLESILLTQLELGEMSKDPVLTEQAYDAYIQFSPKKTKLLEVRYQKAHAAYEKGENGAAAEQLRDVALTKGGDAGLKKQAADLSLDALVLMKDDTRLVQWAREYETAFPQSRGDFSQIIQKTLLTKSADLAVSNPAAALDSLKEFEPAKATPEDKVKFYKNKLLLSEKLSKVSEAGAAADALLAMPKISNEDRELAWSRKAYFAEMRLDFSTAFVAVEKLEKSLEPEEKNFKLAIFAELSGKPSAPFYMKYLSQTKDEERKRLVAAELVRKSKNPEQEIEHVRPVLAGAPELLADLYAEIYAKNASDKVLAKVMKDEKLKTTAAGRLLARQAFFKEFAKIKAPLVNDKLDTKSSAKLAQSIKRRGTLLQKAEGATKQAIESGDWTAQLISIDLLARESERFYNDLMSAPEPQGLTPEEEQQYLSLLQSQAAPFQTKASEAKAKTAQFWQTEWVKPMQQAWEQKPVRKLIGVEIENLKTIAPDDQREKFNAFTEREEAAAKPSIQQLQTARQKVYENPLDQTALEELLKLERKAENTAMSDYLASRLDKLKTKGTL